MEKIMFEKVHYIPLLISVWFPITFIATYIIAVQNEDVSPLFPYISDTGTFAPESCLFGQMLNLGALLVGITAYIRYVQLRDIYENNDVHYRVQKLNWPSCILGMLSGLGISIVGNFQEENNLTVHLIGAVLAFGVGLIYLGIQTYIGFKIRHLLGSDWLNWIRVFLVAGITICFFFVFIFGAVGFLIGDVTNAINPNWKPGEAGWTWHFLSTLSEWILSILLLVALSSFAHDFKMISLALPDVSHQSRRK